MTNPGLPEKVAATGGILVKPVVCTKLQVEAALMYRIVQMFAQAFRSLSATVGHRGLFNCSFIG